MDNLIPEAARAKNELRAALNAARRARSGPERSTAAQANAAHLATYFASCLPHGSTVCGYLPLASEPLHLGLLDELVDAGYTVLVPIVAIDAPLDWCRYPCPTAPGAFGIAEPGGPRLGPESIVRADAVLVPALAVDSSGARLGRGGGHYDRSLALLPASGPPLIAVLFDGELLQAVPAQPHDLAVTAAVLPRRGVVHFRLDGGRHHRS